MQFDSAIVFITGFDLLNSPPILIALHVVQFFIATICYPAYVFILYPIHLAGYLPFQFIYIHHTIYSHSHFFHLFFLFSKQEVALSLQLPFHSSWSLL